MRQVGGCWEQGRASVEWLDGQTRCYNEGDTPWVELAEEYSGQWGSGSDNQESPRHWSKIPMEDLQRLNGAERPRLTTTAVRAYTIWEREVGDGEMAKVGCLPRTSQVPLDGSAAVEVAPLKEQSMQTPKLGTHVMEEQLRACWREGGEWV